MPRLSPEQREGIGAAVAKRLAADGFAVGVLDLDEGACAATVADIEAAGGRAVAVGADVGDEEQVHSAVERVAAAIGGPTVLINNAGLTRDNLLFKMSKDDWDTVMSVHLRGPFLLSRATQKYMVDAGWGRIVNVSSTSAIGSRGQANYSAAKAGIQGFTKTLAIELGRFGITVNAIAPGFHRDEHDRRDGCSNRDPVRRLQGQGRLRHPRGPDRHARGRRCRSVVLCSTRQRLRLRTGVVRRWRTCRLREGSLLCSRPSTTSMNSRQPSAPTWASPIGGPSRSDEVDLFAEATGDHQWIHVDPERAKSGPFGTTVAHGYLTLSLIPQMVWTIFTVEGIRMSLNYGVNKVRFPAPLPVGSRIRASVDLISLEPGGGGFQEILRVTVEREGGDKPVCVADTVSILFP